MKTFKTVLSVFFLFFIMAGTHAATKIAPAGRVALFQGSIPWTSTNWTMGSSGTIGTVQILRSNIGTIDQLLYQKMYDLGSALASNSNKFVLDDVTVLGAKHFRISEKALLYSYPGQCVAFAKSMIGSTDVTSKWHTGTKLSTIPVAQRNSVLVPGIMIAYFNGQSTYPQDGSGHVAIVLSVDSTGVTVADQNFINGYAITVGGIVYAAKPVGSPLTYLGIHKMPWTNSSARRAAGQYHIVDLYGYQYT